MGLARCRGDTTRQQDVFQNELERIFYERWLCVGREEQIPQPGDYFIQSVGEESLDHCAGAGWWGTGLL